MQEEKKIRILIAEDEALIAMSVKAQLEDLGYAVIGQASTGVEALALAHSLNPDLALVDIKMPKMDGLEASQYLIHDLGIPVVLLTAYSEKNFITRAREVGVQAYLVKPITEADLTPAIELALTTHHHLQEMQDKVHSLETALAERKLIERAKGILMDRLKLTEEDSMRRLQREARSQNKKLAEVARSVIAASKLFQNPS